MTDFGGVDTGIDNPESVAVSPEGRSVYGGVESDDAIAAFERKR